jgi:anaerobic magnesium-protoporphyrin IX monomethyl ester cyclase
MSKTLDLLLVTPPSRMQVYQSLSNDFAAIEPPVWSGLIAAYARNRGYSVQMLDAEAESLTHEQTAARIAEANPTLAVFVIYGQQPSASTQCMPAGRKVCELLNDTSDVTTMVMGTHASALPERTLREEPYDYVCQGEGPLTAVGLIDALKGKMPFDQVPSLWHMDGDTARVTLRAANIKDLDEDLPTQAWDMLDMSLYRAHNWHCFDDLSSRERYASIQTSLGCPYKCSFCCINTPFGGNGIRYWSPEVIVKQIDDLVTKYGTRNIKIPDEMFVLNKNHVLGICDLLIERDYDLNIWAYARIDTVQDQFLDKLKKAGFNWLGIGIESGSKFVRDGVTKGKFGDEDIIKTVQKIRDAGIYVAANYIFGLPDDDHDGMQQTLDMAMSLNTEWANFYSAMAYPGSQLYGLAQERGWRTPDTPGGPGWLGYSQHAFDALPLPTDRVPAVEVLKFRDKAFNDYFANPSYLKMIGDQFGADVVSHVQQMTGHTLGRRYHEEPNANIYQTAA